MARGVVLIVDDEPNIRRMLTGVLEDEGWSARVAADSDEAEAALAREPVDVLLLDVNLPGRDGLTLLREGDGLPPVIMMSGHGDIRTALEAVRLGARDFIEKPIGVERLLLSLENAVEMRQLSDENQRLHDAVTHELLGDSPAMVRLRHEIARVAPTDARVLITGENGTGKELVARALHRGSARRTRPFVKVNCAAIPSELLESELFGHEKGAFTGAVSTRRGKFELAQRGTLLLDEIGDMNPTTQAKLLRVLEENELERVGGERSIGLDVRVLASTNRDLPALLADGTFREDLYFRLKVVQIQVPALRDHAEDVPQLVDHYLDHFARENGRPVPTVSAAARQRLARHPWPGNVRELRNLVERMVIMGGESLGPDELSAFLGATVPATSSVQTLAESLEAHERERIQAALREAGGNIAEAGRRLGLDRANLHRRMKRLGLRD